MFTSTQWDNEQRNQGESQALCVNMNTQTAKKWSIRSITLLKDWIKPNRGGFLVLGGLRYLVTN